MKANLYSIVLMAGAMISSVNAFAQPTTSAPTPPELAKSKVISIYSDAYASTDFKFGEWESGSTYALEKIGDTDNVAKFTTTDLGYFGWEFSKVNTAAMDKLHVDIYSDAAFSVRVVPITGGTEVGQTIEVSAGKWTSVDLDTKVFADGGANLANVYQIKFDNVKSQTFYIDNVYFWSTSTDVDTEAPEWGVDPVAQSVTDKSAEIVVNVTDDSGSAVITLTGDNGFAELKKEVKADGSNQTIVLNGLTANTDYNLTLAIADAAGNAGESKTVKFTTLETPDREVLYHSFDFTSENWTKHKETNTFAPNGNILLTVNTDNTVTVKVTVDEGVEAVEFAEFILHEIDNFRINAQEDGSFVGTSTNSISNREALQAFHMNFVLKNGVGNSELAVMYFTPSEGSTSAVAEVEAEAAKVVAANGVIRVEGDKTFAVYTVAGQLAFRGMGEVRLDKGVYVVVVDGKAQKVML